MSDDYIKPHRDMMEIPLGDATSERELIQWILDHPLWSHDMTHRFPPDWETNPDAFFGANHQMRQEDPTWIDHIERDEGSYRECIEFDFVYVNPETNRIDDDKTKNTEFQVWIEAGGWVDQSIDNSWTPEHGWDQYNKWASCHDMDLDCGALCMEDALMELAIRVKFYYNDDGTERIPRPERCEGHFEDEVEEEGWVPGCTKGEDGYCVKCGFEFNPEPTLHDVLTKRIADVREARDA